MKSPVETLKTLAQSAAQNITKTAKTAAAAVSKAAGTATKTVTAFFKKQKNAAKEAFRSLKKTAAERQNARTDRTACTQTDKTSSDQTSKAEHPEKEQTASEQNAAELNESSGQDAAKKAPPETETAAEDNAENPPEAERAESMHRNGGRFRGTVRTACIHAIDVLAGLLFLSAAVISIKPQLLDAALDTDKQPRGLSRILEITEEIGGTLIQVQLKITQNISSSAKTSRNIYVALSLALYIAFKLIVAALAKNNIRQKFVSVLIIAITLAAYTLLSEHILLFAAICLIASLAFAVACGFQVRTIWRKMLICLILALVCYAAAHILTDYSYCRSNHLAGIKDAVIQFGTHLAQFIKTLRLTARH